MTSTQANHYVVTGDGISGTINTAGINGQPVVELEIDGSPLPDPELRDVELGIQVSGVVSSIADLETVKATILVPHVNVGGIADPTSAFAGVALVTTIRTSIGGPRLVAGPLESFSLRPLGGNAQAVAF